MESVLILGASGSLGEQVFHYLKNKKQYKIEAIAGWHNCEKINELSKEVSCSFSHKKTKQCDFNLIKSKRWDIIINCVSGIKGVELSWASAKHTKTLVLGNKETLFLGGKNFTSLNKNITIIPLDSELTSLWYMKKENYFNKEKIFITASGGVLKKEEDLLTLSTKEVLNHPIWKMGTQITIDSSTLINKLFEIYCTSVFFNKEVEDIETYVCRTGEIHAGVCTSKLKSLKFKPSMSEAIDLIFNKNKEKLELINSGESVLEEIDDKIYPLYKHKNKFYENQRTRAKLMNLSFILSREFLLKRITLLEFTKKIISLY